MYRRAMMKAVPALWLLTMWAARPAYAKEDWEKHVRWLEGVFARLGDEYAGFVKHDGEAYAAKIRNTHNPASKQKHYEQGCNQTNAHADMNTRWLSNRERGECGRMTQYHVAPALIARVHKAAAAARDKIEAARKAALAMLEQALHQ